MGYGGRSKQARIKVCPRWKMAPFRGVQSHLAVRALFIDGKYPRYVVLDGHLVAGQIVIAVETDPLVDNQLLHQGGTHAHRHSADHLASCRLGVQYPTGSAN